MIVFRTCILQENTSDNLFCLFLKISIKRIFRTFKPDLYSILTLQLATDPTFSYFCTVLRMSPMLFFVRYVQYRIKMSTFGHAKITKNIHNTDYQYNTNYGKEIASIFAL